MTVMKKIIIIARCKSEASRYAQLNGIDGFYHASKPEQLLGIERGSSYAITPEFECRLRVSGCRELNEMILKRGLVRYERVTDSK